MQWREHINNTGSKAYTANAFLKQLSGCSSKVKNTVIYQWWGLYWNMFQQFGHPNYAQSDLDKIEMVHHAAKLVSDKFYLYCQCYNYACRPQLPTLNANQKM